MGIMSLIAALLCLFLPETRFKPTMENIDQTIVNNNTEEEEEKNDDTAENEEKKALVLDETSSKV